ncbi:MAG: acyl-ACP--UDP-N-acetylglucosamine O-acyltransferase [Verrucomicrobiota bacterium]
MSNAKIHPTAIVEPGVRLGTDCEIMAYAVITRHCVLGDRVTVWPHAVLGGDPQDLKFDRAITSGVRIGPGTVIRESVTVNRATRPGGETVVGADCFLMAASHVGHDCTVGDHVILANAALLAGHVSLGANSFVGGGAAIHQFVRVGEGVMIGGLTAVSLDLPPYVLAANRNELAGLNLVGLKRRGVAREAIAELKELFRTVCGATGNPRVLAAARLAGARSPEARRFLEFFAGSKRGFARTRQTMDKTSGDE